MEPKQAAPRLHCWLIGCLSCVPSLLGFLALLLSIPASSGRHASVLEQPAAEQLSTDEPAADFQLKWTGDASAVSVIGDWNGWKRPGLPMHRDESGTLAADVRLPSNCSRSKLAVVGVCCYRFKFVVTDAATQRHSWRTDPSQPVDTDSQGNVNNVLCKYGATRNGASQTKPRRNAADGRRQHAGGPSTAPVEKSPGAGGPTVAVSKSTCLLLTATAFNGSALAHESTRSVWGCCDACQRRKRCTAYNWRAEPLAQNCMLLGEERGHATGNALSSAGLMHRSANAGTRAVAAGQSAAASSAPRSGATAATRRPKRAKKRTKKRHAGASKVSGKKVAAG